MRSWHFSRNSWSIALTPGIHFETDNPNGVGIIAADVVRDQRVLEERPQAGLDAEA